MSLVETTQIEQCNKKNSFSERVVKVWNSLLPSIVNFSSFATFRNSLNKTNLRIYQLNINAFNVSP